MGSVKETTRIASKFLKEKNPEEAYKVLKAVVDEGKQDKSLGPEIFWMTARACLDYAESKPDDKKWIAALMEEAITIIEKGLKYFPEVRSPAAFRVFCK